MDDALLRVLLDGRIGPGEMVRCLGRTQAGIEKRVERLGLKWPWTRAADYAGMRGGASRG